ncbi:methionine--tRNA ligase, cytoplasmic [Ischnura elegans]|uniref:methionine--tRNA ligase, cytoplasmic n=1 Tax=Ischnura elegans TaxID=197161 RepID=UPI001ED8AF5A|nr:methionine--tRNA ligase, cytoplasmic [Ischnura elegans]
MKIRTTTRSSSTLKLLIAANLADAKLDVEVADSSGLSTKGQTLLILDNGREIFSSNAGAWLLMKEKFGKKPAEESILDQWLEWEAVVLQPAADSTHPLRNEKRPSNDEIITKVEQALKKSSYLAETKGATVADVCVWSSLHFMIADQDDLLSSYPEVKKWYDKLSSLEAFKAAVQKLSVFKAPSGPQPESGKAKVQAVKPKPPVAAASPKKAPVNLESESPEPGVASEDEIVLAVKNWKLGPQNGPKAKTPVKPVLPVGGERNILITSALPYVNNVPHLGNIIGCVLSADVFARYCRLRGYNALYICGTDEYGTATETKALEEGVTPQDICDRYHKLHAQVYQWFNISFDHFGRTSTIQHAAICQKLFSEVHRNGYTITDSVEQQYCKNCKRFLADRFVEGTCPWCAYEDARGDQCDSCGRLVNANELKNPRCKLCSNTPCLKTSTHLFLDLPKIEPKLRDWMNTVSDGWSNNSQVIARSWLKDGLKPRCITRDLKWGIPVPVQGFEGKVFYVWFDAPIGYMSILNCYTDEWEKWWKPKKPVEVKYFQFMAKDNVPFHSVMFPSCILAANPGFKAVDHLMATEYLNYEEGKFSKSRGVGVFGPEAESTGIPSDIWRFYLTWVRPENQDSAFIWSDLAQRNNSELLNNFGNFALRALTFVEKFFESKVPEINIDGEFERALVGAVNKELKEYLNLLENARSLRDALRRLLVISRHGNLLMQSSQPWVLVKGSPEDRKKGGSVVGLCANLACLLSMLLSPYMPETARQLHQQLNAPPEAMVIPNHFYCLLPAGHKIGKPFPLFSKIENSQMDELRNRFSGNQKNRSPGPTNEAKPAVTPVKDVKSQSTTAESVSTPKASNEEILRLQAEVEKQGGVVRDLKAKGLPKSDWEHELQKLLELKTKLLSLDPSSAPSKGSGSSGKKGKSKKSK